MQKEFFLLPTAANLRLAKDGGGMRFNPYSTEYRSNIINIVVTLQQHCNIAAILLQYSVLYGNELGSVLTAILDNNNIVRCYLLHISFLLTKEGLEHNIIIALESKLRICGIKIPIQHRILQQYY